MGHYNRTASSWGSVNHSYAYPATSNRLTSRTGPTAASSNSYSYDAAGNMIGDGKFKYDYSDGGRLIAFKTLADAVQYRYDYNAKGERVLKKGGVYDRRFVYDEDGRLLGEYDKATTFWQEYVWLGDTLVATIRLAPVAGQPKTIQYVFTDHLDTPRAMAKPDAASTLTWRWESEAFGNSPANGDADGDGQQVYLNLRFPGQYWDGELGRHYNYFRDYDPALGRYVQSDPIGLRGGVNTYGYVGGNPVASRDSQGLWSVTVGGYYCAGAELTFGRDNGNGFLTGRVGLGLGGGISWDPNGGIPGPEIKDRSKGGVVLSDSIAGGFAAGPPIRKYRIWRWT